MSEHDSNDRLGGSGPMTNPKPVLGIIGTLFLTGLISALMLSVVFI